MFGQNIKADAGKPRLKLVPPEIITAIARVREYGIEKYHKRDSWKQVAPERYKDAAYRHFLNLYNICADCIAYRHDAAIALIQKSEEAAYDDHDVSGLLED